jgi:hypothetical protein
VVDIMGIVLGVIGAIVAIGNTDYCKRRERPNPKKNIV